MAQYAKGEIDAVYVVCAQYKSALSSPPASERVLPVTPPAKAAGGQKDFLLFPDAGAILSELLPAYVRNAVYKALVETVAAEQAARRTAMKNATDNAGEMLNLAAADVQPGAAGEHHAGDCGDCRWSCGARVGRTTGSRLSVIGFR